jgi:hypothetical protein
MRASDRFEHVRRRRAREQNPGATAGPRPQDSASPSRTAFTRARLPDFDERRQPDAERIADPQQCRDAQVRDPLLNVDDHATAHPRRTRELVQGPLPGLALDANFGPDRCRQLARTAHAMHHGALLVQRQ